MDKKSFFIGTLLLSLGTLHAQSQQEYRTLYQKALQMEQAFLAAKRDHKNNLILNHYTLSTSSPDLRTLEQTRRLLQTKRRDQLLLKQ